MGVPPDLIERFKYLLSTLPVAFFVYDIAKRHIQIRDIYVTRMLCINKVISVAKRVVHDNLWFVYIKEQSGIIRLHTEESLLLLSCHKRMPLRIPVVFLSKQFYM